MKPIFASSDGVAAPTARTTQPSGIAQRTGDRPAPVRVPQMMGREVAGDGHATVRPVQRLSQARHHSDKAAHPFRRLLPTAEYSRKPH
jgi:hypothetical protein